jgi:nitrogen fixation protein FixH
MDVPGNTIGDRERGGPGKVTGWTVLVYLVAFFAVVAVVNAVMIGAALSTFAGLETDSPYEKGLAFEREMAAAQAQDALHWQVEGNVARSQRGETIAEISARDASGRPLTGVALTAALVHPADERLDHSFSVHEDAPGHFRGTTDVANGQWDLVIEISRADRRLFRSKNRITLP